MLTSIHPPVQSLTLVTEIGSNPLHISAYAYNDASKTAAGGLLISVKDNQDLQKQNNFTNLTLTSIGEQLTRVEENVVSLRENSGQLNRNIKKIIPKTDLPLQETTKDDESIKSVEQDFAAKSDTSMRTQEDPILAGESQDPNDESEFEIDNFEELM